MATSSVKKNFVVYGFKQAERFADAIEESYQASLKWENITSQAKYRELRDPDEINSFMEKWKKTHGK